MQLWKKKNHRQALKQARAVICRVFILTGTWEELAGGTAGDYPVQPLLIEGSAGKVAQDRVQMCFEYLQG